MRFTEIDFVLNKEFTSDDKEQNNCRQDITDRGIHTEICRYLPCPRIKKGNEEGCKDHNQRVEFGKPRNENKLKVQKLLDVSHIFYIIKVMSNRIPHYLDMAGNPCGTTEVIFYF